jgi:DNA-binding LytR/AlgR family response regulator
MRLTMIRAVIADDEPTFAKLLKRILEDTDRVKVVRVVSDGAEAVEAWEEESPDVLFLDIEMPKLGGVEVAEMVLNSEDPPVVAFISGHDEYAAKAFELDAVDYVVKQTDTQALRDRIEEMLDRIGRALEQRQPAVEELRARINAISSKLESLESQTGGSRVRWLPVKDYDEGTVRLVDPETVICVERKDRRVVLRTAESEWPTYYTLDSLEERLGDRGFVRANRSALINVAYIEHLIPNGDGSYDVVLREAEGLVVTVSRSRSKELLSSL